MDRKGNPLTIKFMDPTYITRAEAGNFANKPQIAYTCQSGTLGSALKLIIDRYEELIHSALDNKELKISKKKAKIYLPIYAETKEGEEIENPLIFINIGVRGPGYKRVLSCVIGESIDGSDGKSKFRTANYTLISSSTLAEFI